MKRRRRWEEADLYRHLRSRPPQPDTPFEDVERLPYHLQSRSHAARAHRISQKPYPTIPTLPGRQTLPIRQLLRRRSSHAFNPRHIVRKLYRIRRHGRLPPHESGIHPTADPLRSGSSHLARLHPRHNLLAPPLRSAQIHPMAQLQRPKSSHQLSLRSPLHPHAHPHSRQLLRRLLLLRLRLFPLLPWRLPSPRPLRQRPRRLKLLGGPLHRPYPARRAPSTGPAREMGHRSAALPPKRARPLRGPRKRRARRLAHGAAG